LDQPSLQGGLVKRLYVKFVFFALAGLVLPALLSAGPRQSAAASKPAPAASKPAPAASKPAPAASKPAPAQDLTPLKSMGSREAPITIEVFSDYQCPQCRVFYLDTARQLMQSYIPAGKVYYVHRDFPLSMHSHSREAARWASAAAIAGVFQTTEETLYSKQDQWGATGKIEDVLAGALSPTDMKKVRTVEATQGTEIDAAIAKDMALGDSRGVNGTPSIYVFHKGQMTPLPPGGVNYSLLKQYIDYLLQQR
jgi:protein-disulfide isomerase